MKNQISQVSSTVPTVNYPVSIPYRSVPSMRGLQPAAEVVLFNGERSTVTVGVFDSGSVFTIFSPQFAQLIGIENVTDGRPDRVATLGGPRVIYFFDLEIKLSAIGERFGSQVAFFEEHVPRNILGRSVIFSAFEIGFHERGGNVHLRTET